MLIRQRLLDEEMRIAREQRELEEKKIKKRRAKEKEKVPSHIASVYFRFFIGFCIIHLRLYVGNSYL